MKRALEDYHVELVILWHDVEGLTYETCLERLRGMGLPPIKVESLQRRVKRLMQRSLSPVVTNPSDVSEGELLRWMQGTMITQIYAAKAQDDDKAVRSSVKTLLEILRAKKGSGVQETEDESKTISNLLQSVRRREVEA